MATETEQHVALPILYGAPAYARPPRPAAPPARPLDLDDLPIEAERTDEERAAAAVAARSTGPRAAAWSQMVEAFYGGAAAPADSLSTGSHLAPSAGEPGGQRVAGGGIGVAAQGAGFRRIASRLFGGRST